MADDEQTDATGTPDDGGVPEDAGAPDAGAPDDATPDDAAAAAAESAVDKTQDALEDTAAEVADSPAPSEDEAAALAAVQSALAGISGDADAAAPAAASGPADVANGGGGGAAPPMAQPAPAGAQSFEPPEFNRVPTPAHQAAIDLLGDVNLNVTIELGRTRMMVEDVLRLNDGAVVELDKLAGDPVDVYVNGRPVARGEVLVLNDTFCVRVNQVLDAASEVLKKSK